MLYQVLFCEAAHVYAFRNKPWALPMARDMSASQGFVVAEKRCYRTSCF